MPKSKFTKGQIIYIDKQNNFTIEEILDVDEEEHEHTNEYYLIVLCDVNGKYIHLYESELLEWCGNCA